MAAISLLVPVLREQYLLLEPSVRKEKIHELVRESKENEKSHS